MQPDLTTRTGVTYEAGQPEPACVAPDCPDRPTLEFTAAESGRLGGRDFWLGDKITVCPRHGADLHAAQSAMRRDHLAKWLRPDAGPFLDELMEAAEGGVPDAARKVREYVNRELGREGHHAA